MKKKKARKAKTGVCALLGTEGPFAKSHLIPEALTRPDQSGAKFVETGRSSRPITRPTSWYDHELLGHAGEKILSQIDDAAIKILRAKKLVWSSWPAKAMKLETNDFAMEPTGDNGMFMREIPFTAQESGTLKLFYLSIIWRFLKSKMEIFSYLINIGLDLDDIATHIIAMKTPAKGKYLISLHQLGTRGFTHNHSPTIQEMSFDSANLSPRQFYRIYFQGLTAHIHVDKIESSKMFLAEEDTLVLSGCNFENSKQHLEAVEAMKEAIELWPEHSSRLVRDDWPV